MRIEDILPEGWQLVELYDNREFDNNEPSYTASIIKPHFAGMLSGTSATPTTAVIAASNAAREYELKYIKRLE